MTFNAKPQRIMNRIGILPVANTMAFGAVATGNMNAQETDRTAGSIICMGEIPPCIAAEDNTGISKCMEAVFEVTSVRKVVTEEIAITNIGKGNVFQEAIHFPTSVLRPLL